MLNGANSPPQIDLDRSRKAHKCVSHQRHAATLWCTTEECDFRFLLLQFRRIMRHSIPRHRLACLLIVLEHMHVGAEPGINLHDPAIPNLQQRRETRAERPAVVSLVKYKYRKETYVIDFLAIESACSSTPLSFQNVKFSISFCEPSWSGHSASGTRSSSDHSLEHSDGLTFSRSTGKPPPMYLHRDLYSYLRRDSMTKSAIGSVWSRGVGRETLCTVKS